LFNPKEAGRALKDKNFAVPVSRDLHVQSSLIWHDGRALQDDEFVAALMPLVWCVHFDKPAAEIPN